MVAHGPQMDRGNVRDLDFDQLVVNIGSHPENDVVLAGEGILPFHAMVVWQDGSFHLTRLSSEARISLDEIPLHEETIALAEGRCITIGNYGLSFGRNHLPAGMHVSVTAPGTGAAPAPVVPLNPDNPISVNVISQPEAVQVDQSAIYELEVVNAGPIVAEFSVSLQGVPAEWGKIVPLTLNLNEHARATVTITITPPRDPSSTAGPHSVKATVSSPNYPNAEAPISLDLFIEPYYEFSLGSLTPRQQNIYWHKRYGTVKLPISNLGNGPADFTVLALDDENGCSFEFHPQDGQRINRQATIPIQAGSTLDLPIDITPLKRPIFALRNKSYQYTTSVHIAQEAASQQAASGSVTSYPLFGWWQITLSLIVVLLGLYTLFHPRIQDFWAEQHGKKTIEIKAGDSATLNWRVWPSFATRVHISGETIPDGHTSLPVSLYKKTTYTLEAESLFHDLLGRKKRNLTINVDPGLVITTISPKKDYWQKGDKITITVGFTSSNLQPSPTGQVIVVTEVIDTKEIDTKVIVTYSSDQCRVDLSMKKSSCDLIFKTSGENGIKAEYLGDTNYAKSKFNYPQKLDVQSVEVELNPTFYDPDKEPAELLNDVEHKDFQIDDGLRMIVEVRPKTENTTLSDIPGKIEVKICEQDTNGKAITSTCIPIGSSPVKVAADTPAVGQKSGYGYAMIDIKNFKATGTRALLFTYTHPFIKETDYTQPYINIQRAELQLSLNTCEDPIEFASCTYGIKPNATTTPDIIFDLYLVDSGVSKLLSSELPRPQAVAFSISGFRHSDCSIKNIDGTYKLVCNVPGLKSGETYKVTYTYDNRDPLPQRQPNDDKVLSLRNDYKVLSLEKDFDLNVRTDTRIVIEPLNRIKVGERILLTSSNEQDESSDPAVTPIPSPKGVIEILDPAGTSIPGRLIVEASGGKDIFGVVNEGVNCKRAETSEGNKIIIRNTKADCHIYFKHTGSYTLEAIFEGNDDYMSSHSSQMPVRVEVQDKISATFKHEDVILFNDAAPFQIQAELKGPDGTHSSRDNSFPAEALVGRKVWVTLSTNSFSPTQKCIIADSEEKTSREVTIMQLDKSGIPAVNFGVFCSDSDEQSRETTGFLRFTLIFSTPSDSDTRLQDSADFGFEPAVAISNIPIIWPSSEERATISVKPIVTVGTPAEMVEDSENINYIGSDVHPLYFGQEYLVTVDVDTFKIEKVETKSTICPFGMCQPPDFDFEVMRNSLMTGLNNSYWNVDASPNLPISDQDECVKNRMIFNIESTPEDEFLGKAPADSLGVVWNFYYRTVVTVKATGSCKLIFDSVSGRPDNPDQLLDESITITITDNSSPDNSPKFGMSKFYKLPKVTKQDVKIHVSPESRGITNRDMPITVTLMSDSIQGGTPLPFISGPITAQFVYIPRGCPKLTLTYPKSYDYDAFSPDNPLNSFTLTYNSSTVIASPCTLTLQYIGNKYFNATDKVDLPSLTFVALITDTSVQPAKCNVVWKEYPSDQLATKNRSEVWKDIVIKQVPRPVMTTQQFYDEVVKRNPQLETDDYVFKKGKSYLLPKCE